GLGATLFCALTGHAAFERRSGEQVVTQFLRIATEAAPDLRGSGISDDIAAVVEGAMSRDPHDRPSPLALGEELQQAQARHDFPDGVRLVELGELRDASSLTDVVAAGLGLRDEPTKPLSEVLIDFLCSRKLLLVLDNCEHVVDAAAKLAETLLRACPDLRIMATSREALGIGGEAVLRLSPLAFPEVDPEPTLGGLPGFDAVALFAERAAAALPGFRLT